MAKPIMSIIQTTKFVVDNGKAKIKKNFITLLFQGFIAGVFISLGAIGYFRLAAYAADSGVMTFIASAIFPMGIIAILLFGAELFTSDNMMILGSYNGEYSIWKTLRVLTIVWIANLLGAIFISGLSSLADIFNSGMTQHALLIAETKVSMPVTKLIFSGILCNIIVCSAVWIAYGVKSALAKIAVLWFMITVFMLSGTEHIVANMYYLSIGYMLGADITIGGILYNFLYVTIGNLIGGAVIVTGINKMILYKADKQKVIK